MEFEIHPKLELAKKVLPSELFKSIDIIFENKLKDVVLVGGTALSGFYFGHRISNDIDLFTKDELSFKAAKLSINSLIKKGAILSDQYDSSIYFKALCKFNNYTFTIDIVLDENVFKECEYHSLNNGINVLSLRSLLITKAATLVSRASEKDLYDILYLTKHFHEDSVETLIDLGRRIDAGLSAESLLVSLGGTNINIKACDFSVTKIKADEIFKEISIFKKNLIQKLQEYLKGAVAPKFSEIFNKIKKLDK